MTDKTTPLPWKVGYQGATAVDVECGAEHIATVYGKRNREIAAEIVQAVNERTGLIAEVERLRATVADLTATFEAAVKIIRDHVPSDALGIDDNGMDAPLCQSWPILDEALYHFDECIKDAKSALSPSKVG